MNPSFKEEQKLWSRNIKHVIGIDEVGRGAFAGPIVAAGVIYKPNFSNSFLNEIKDSKQLTPKKRDELSKLIKKHSNYFVITKVELDYINKFGIGRANKKAIEKIIKQMALIIGNNKFYSLIDGIQKEESNKRGIIKGDSISISIASASIIAKVYRDDLMVKLSDDYPIYDFSKNKGYGTKIHRDAIGEYGLCDLHRTSFNLSKFTQP